MAEQAEVLEHNADAAPEDRERLSRRIAQLLAEQPDPAPRRPLREIEQLEQRGLARARRTGEEIEPAVVQPEVEIAQDLGPGSVPKPDAIEFRNLRQLIFPPPCLAKPGAFLFTLSSAS
jgi:hypothetical protein